jgi:hypothetical protein
VEHAAGIVVDLEKIKEDCTKDWEQKAKQQQARKGNEGAPMPL